MGGASLTLGMSHGYAFGLRLGSCLTLVSYPVFFFQNRSSSPKDNSKTYILHSSGASAPLTLIFHEVLLDWEVTGKSFRS